MRVKETTILLSLITTLIFACEAKPKRVNSLEAKESAAAVFVYLMNNGTTGGGWYEKGDIVYIQATSNHEDVTSSATLKHYKSEGLRAYPRWLVRKHKPKVDYSCLSLSNPIRTPWGIKWEIVKQEVPLSSKFDGSVNQMWIWMNKKNGKWQSVKIQGGVSAG